MDVKEFELGIGPLVVLVLYLVVMIGIGWLGKMRRREESLSDFYLGGSSFGLVVLFLTLFATQYSGNTLLGFAGRSYRQGGTYIVSVMFMTLAIATITLYAPRLFRLSRIFGYVTPADFIYHRFGSHALRIVAVLLLCWGLANYILEQLVAMGHAMEVLSGGKIPFMWGVVLLVLVMLIYESLGGMRSVAWTDTIQGSLLFVGCGAILYILLTSEGGLPAAAEVIQVEEPAKFEAPGAAGIRAWVSTLILLSFGVAFYPHAIQRIFAARSLGSLRIAIGGMALMPFVTTLLAFLIGIIALSRFPGLDSMQSDRVTLFLLSDIINTNIFTYWLVVLVFVALVAAIMSTADSALLSIGSMFTKDIYNVYIRKNSDPRHLLRVGKISGWLLMIVLVTMAWVSLKTESSIWLLIKLKLEFMVQISPVFLLGMFWRRVTAMPILAGVAAGTTVTLVLWGGVIVGWWSAETRSPLGISAGVWGLALNYAVCLSGAFLFPAPPLEDEAG